MTGRAAPYQAGRLGPSEERVWQSPSPVQRLGFGRSRLGPGGRADWGGGQGPGAPPRAVTGRCPLRAAAGSPTDSIVSLSRRFNAGEGRITEALQIRTLRKGVVTLGGSRCILFALFERLK